MPRKGSDFAGLSVAMTTPFKNGDVDYETLRAQVDFQVEAGTACLCPTGTTGESPTLTHEEHEQAPGLDPVVPLRAWCKHWCKRRNPLP